MDQEAVPACFSTVRLYRNWRAMNDRCTWSGGRAQAVCADCTPGYQLAMKAQRRCEHPEVGFTVEDGAVVGVIA